MKLSLREGKLFLESGRVYLNYLNRDSNPLTPFSNVGNTTNSVALGLDT